MREIVEDARLRAGGSASLASMLGLSDPRVVDSWAAGKRAPQSRFRAAVLEIAGLDSDWRDLPRAELAEILGVHVRTVAAWQRGEREMPARHCLALRALHAGHSLRSWRREQGLTTQELAQQLEVHPDTVLAWERNDRAPGFSAHHRLYKTVGVVALWWWPLSELERLRRANGWERETVCCMLDIDAAKLSRIDRGEEELTDAMRAVLVTASPSKEPQ